MVQSDRAYPDDLDHRLRALHAAASEVAAGLERLREDVESTHSNRVGTSETTSPCASCPEYATCTEPCEELLELLSAEDAGRSRSVKPDISLDVLQHDHGIVRRTGRDLFERFLACRAELTPKRWEVVVLVHGQGLSQKEAARRLGKAESTVSELLSEATNTMNAFFSRRKHGSP